MTLLAATQDLSGWGRHPRLTCQVYRPERRADVGQLLASPGAGTWIGRGLGRSYGDAALNAEGAVMVTTRLDRMLAFDEDTGVLVCEAGVSLAVIIETFLPRGWFLAVTPGTRFVTVGGAIAHDVHGKNHHGEGSFAGCTRGFTLQTPGGEVLECAPDRNAEVYWATLGGAGLTGVVLLAAIQLRRVETAWMRVDELRAPDLDAALACMTELDHRYTYAVAWIDVLARGRAMGRSVLMHGEHLPAAEAAGLRAPAPGGLPTLHVPCDAPAGLLNRLSVAAFNQAFWWAHPTRSGLRIPLESYFYPLDRLGGWNRLYGPRGFIQYQVLFPPAQAQAGLTAVLERLSRDGAPSFLAVLKRMGPATPGPLSFPAPGFTLALDLPWHPETAGLVAQLDAITLHHGGRLYLAKDATAHPDTIAAMYPRLEEFRRLRARLDPRGRLSSTLARRVGLL
ncbi:MAG: FAD-binding oxidoreductase [Candidatus Sericytochromatia bacterium]|nr:FAD-binding oxidoreductase [Candidatus Sericytochromatia bacterium]